MKTRLALGLMVALAACAAPATLHAQVPAPPAPHSAANVSKAPPPPPLPAVKSPVDQFRDLLAMTPAAREVSLSNRAPEIRRRILAKVAEYEAMPPKTREDRLSVTQLRWYLPRLTQMSAADRAGELAQISDADRQLVSKHLQAWDQMPSNDQKEILKYEKTMEQISDQHLDIAANSNPQVSAQSSNALRNIDIFFQLPAEQRKQIYSSFVQFFELNDAEKQKTLSALPEHQRQLTAGTMQIVAKLSPDDRAQYLDALGRFSKMTDTERRQFMKNAEEWQKLSPLERQAWRGLVKHLSKQPPLPPGLVFPPMPPGFQLQANTTNRTHPSP